MWLIGEGVKFLCQAGTVIVADADSQARYLNDGVLFMAIYSPSPDVTTYRTRATLSGAFVRVA